MAENATSNSLLEGLDVDLVYALACTADLRVCFAARGSGLYRAVDPEGEAWTWEYCYDSLNLEGPMPTTSVVLEPGYDGETRKRLFAGVPGGVLRSSDGGETWFASILDSPPPAVSALAISPNYAEDGVILAATTEDGIFRSASHGTHWSRWNFGLLDLAVFCLAISPGFAQDETLFAGVESGIFRSMNGGRAWREVELPVGYEPVVSLALSPGYAVDGTIFAGTETQGLLASEDGGAHWERLGEGVIVDPVNGLLVSPDFPDSPDILVLTQNALWLSRNRGTDWAKLTPASQGMTAFAAPQGLAPGAPLLIGLMGGEVRRVALDEA